MLGLNTQGDLQSFDLFASTYDEAQQEALQHARRTGVQLVDVSSADGSSSNGARHRLFDKHFLHRDRFDLSLFVYELLTLLRAGLALTEALETLDERWRKSHGNKADAQSHYVLPDLVRLMQQGKSFSAALAQHPSHFSTLFVAMIAASERTGGMTDALERYLHYHTQVGIVRQKLISASLYPALLMCTGLAVALFLIWFLAPRFAHVYDGMQSANLPVLSRYLLKAGLYVNEHTVMTLGGLTIAMIVTATSLTRPSVQQRCLALFGRIHWIGEKSKLLQLARFYRSLGMLLHGGVALLPSLEMTRDLLPLHLQERLSRSMTGISQGKRMSDSLDQEGLMTTIAQRLLRAGERNGQIASMLEQAATFHEREIAQWVERFARLIEPILMLLMGLGIGAIVVLLYLPVFDLAGNLQ